MADSAIDWSSFDMMDTTTFVSDSGDEFSGGALTGDYEGLSDPGFTTGSDIPLGDPGSDFSVDELWSLYNDAPGQAGPDAGDLLGWNTDLAGNSDGSPMSDSQVVYEDLNSVYFADGSSMDKSTGDVFDANGNLVGSNLSVAGSAPNSYNGGRGYFPSFGVPSSSGGASKGAAGGGAPAISKAQQSLGSSLASLLGSVLGKTQQTGSQISSKLVKPSQSPAQPAKLSFAGVSLTTIIFGGLLLWLAFGRK